MFKFIIGAIKSTNKTIREEGKKVKLIERIKLYKTDVLLGIYTYLEYKLFH